MLDKSYDLWRIGDELASVPCRNCGALLRNYEAYVQNGFCESCLRVFMVQQRAFEDGYYFWREGKREVRPSL